MKYIVRTCGNSERWINHLKRGIPELIVCKDRTKNAMNTFLDALTLAGNDACVHLEDDIILTKDFKKKIEKIIEEHPNVPIQFFSKLKDDLTIGTRVRKGRTFLWAQCFYLPKNISHEILAYYPIWGRIKEHPTGLDIMVADYFGRAKIDYIHYVPSLVQHRSTKSRINPRRSTKRQSPTFIDGDILEEEYYIEKEHIICPIRTD